MPYLHLWASYGVSNVSILEKLDCIIIGVHCVAKSCWLQAVCVLRQARHLGASCLVSRHRQDSQTAIKHKVGISTDSIMRFPVSLMLLLNYFSNSLAPGVCGSKFKILMVEHMLQIKFISCSYQIALRWMPWKMFDDR